jgi:hypothetical protein
LATSTIKLKRSHCANLCVTKLARGREGAAMASFPRFLRRSWRKRALFSGSPCSSWPRCFGRRAGVTSVPMVRPNAKETLRPTAALRIRMAEHHASGTGASATPTSASSPEDRASTHARPSAPWLPLAIRAARRCHKGFATATTSSTAPMASRCRSIISKAVEARASTRGPGPANSGRVRRDASATRTAPAVRREARSQAL